MKFISNVPEGAGRVVGLISFNGHVILACENGVFMLTPKGLEPMRFAQQEDNSYGCPFSTN